MLVIIISKMNFMKPKPQRIISWFLLLGALIFSASVRYRLLAFPLDRDEGEYAYAGQLLLEGVPPYKFAYNMKLPGTYLAYAGLMAVFGLCGPDGGVWSDNRGSSFGVDGGQPDDDRVSLRSHASIVRRTDGRCGGRQLLNSFDKHLDVWHGRARDAFRLVLWPGGDDCSLAVHAIR